MFGMLGGVGWSGVEWGGVWWSVVEGGGLRSGWGFLLLPSFIILFDCLGELKPMHVM